MPPQSAEGNHITAHVVGSGAAENDTAVISSTKLALPSRSFALKVKVLVLAGLEILNQLGVQTAPVFVLLLKSVAIKAPFRYTLRP